MTGLYEVVHALPPIIEAVEWRGDNYDEVHELAGDLVDVQAGALLLLAGVNGSGGWRPVPLGSWVVRIPGRSDCWRFSPRQFAKLYQPLGTFDSMRSSARN